MFKEQREANWSSNIQMNDAEFSTMEIHIVLYIVLIDANYFNQMSNHEELIFTYFICVCCRCFIMEDRGYLVAHPTLIDPKGHAPAEQQHITHKVKHREAVAQHIHHIRYK